MSGPPPPDAASDGEMIEALHSESFGRALTCCGGRPDDAKEVLHMSYAKYLSGRARYDGRSMFKRGWFGVVRLSAREHQRSGTLCPTR